MNWHSPVSTAKFLALLFVIAVTIQAEEITVDATPRWNSTALEAALDYAESQRSSVLVVAQSGEIVAERYWSVEAVGSESAYGNMLWQAAADGQLVEDVASVQKSVVSVLVGMAADQGLLDLDGSVSSYLGEGWSAAHPEHESKIQLRHLLSMTSGLSTELEYEALPGTTWFYNTNAYSKTIEVLEAVTDKEIDTVTRNWLTEPMDMPDTEWRRRPWVNEGMDANTLGFYTTARDLIHFGELMLRQGEWRNQRLVSSDYVQAAVSPSQALNPAYGYLWWLNGQPSPNAAGESVGTTLVPSAPDDLYAAQGALGRKLYIVPSLDLVVVRLGDSPEENFNQRFWRLLMRAMPTTMH